MSQAFSGIGLVGVILEVEVTVKVQSLKDDRFMKPDLTGIHFKCNALQMQTTYWKQHIITLLEYFGWLYCF